MQKKILFFISSLALSLGFGSAHSQNVPFRKYCATDSMTEVAIRQNPDYARKRREFMEYVKTMNNQSIARLTSSPTYTIPIVVHIIHTYGADNISDAQVNDAVRIINEDYSKLNADTGNVVAVYQPLYAKVGFNFKLAKKDPTGACTTGITRTYSTLTNSANDNVKGLIMWDPTKYLNIWVVNSISFGAGGYSYLPCGVPQNIEGVVILNTQFGSIGKSNGGNFSARSLTHEIGHYFGLPHVWGGSNTPGDPNNCGMDDGIADTPNTIGSTGFSCSTNARTCNPASFPFPDNVQNYMDYSSCAKMFTNGQKAVMVSALTMFCRSNLATASNLVATGTDPGYTSVCAPIADFKISSDRICSGGTVTFSDQSYNTISGSSVTRLWNFPGGTPATSTAANPVVIYSTPGIYDVTLTTSNNMGANSRTKTSSVVVRPSLSTLGAPYSYGFETSAFPIDPTDPQKSWEVIQPANSGWERTMGAFATGTASIRVRNQSVPVGTVNTLISPALNLTNAVGASLKFKVANAQRTATTSDRLSVYFSNDCGTTWSLRYNKAGSLLTTVSQLYGSFIPASSDWRQETVSISSGFIGPNTLIKFEATSDQGNNLYLDDIEIVSNVNGVSENKVAQASLNIYPNPSSGEATISFTLPNDVEYTLEVFSVTGQQIGKTVANRQQSGKQEFNLRNLTGQANLKAGVYLVKLQTSGFTTLQKAIVF